MAKIIKTYKARFGDVEITKYDENDDVQYRVVHTYKPLYFCTSWFADKVEAIKFAQFLAGKY